MHSFVLKHIFHVIEFRTIYNLMSSLTTDMTRIPYTSLYSDLLNGNLIIYNSRSIFSFNSVCFNIVIYPLTICIVHFYFLYSCLKFQS